MPLLIITGGQSGADQAALRAADRCGVPTGGFAAKGWLAEVKVEDEHGVIGWFMKPCPWLAEHDLVECQSPGFAARTVANVKAADAVLWFGDEHSKGGTRTMDTARILNKPNLIVRGKVTKPSDVAGWIEKEKIRRLMVAGNRESKAPGIGERTEAFLVRVFKRLDYPEIPREGTPGNPSA